MQILNFDPDISDLEMSRIVEDLGEVEVFTWNEEAILAYCLQKGQGYRDLLAQIGAFEEMSNVSVRDGNVAIILPREGGTRAAMIATYWGDRGPRVLNFNVLTKEDIEKGRFLWKLAGRVLARQFEDSD